MTGPNWLSVARRHLGLKEVKGPEHNSIITGWLNKLGAWYQDDETPWCGTFVAACLFEVGYTPPKYWMRAKAWAEWGQAIPGPALGAIVVFERQGGGHVGFVVGKDARGRLMVLGGNQGDAVSIAPFDLATRKVLGYRWPGGVPMTREPLPLYGDVREAASIQEA